MATVSKIGTTASGCAGGTCDFTSLQAWHDAFTTGGWEGQAYADNEFFAASATVLAMSGKSTSATNFIKLTAAAGQSFVDNANAQTNALKYNTANGVGLNCQYTYGQALTCSEDFATISRLQITGKSGPFQVAPSSSTSIVVDQCLAEATASTGATSNFGGAFALYSGGGVARNCIAIQRTNGAAAIAIVSNGASAYNCTFVAPSDLASHPTAAIHNAYTAGTLENCAFFGASAISSGTTPTFTTCMTDLTGTTGVTGGKTYANQFQNTTNASGDWRLKAGADLIDAGTTDTTHVPSGADIVGTTRPQGSAWDIGCWEFVSGGGGGNTDQPIPPQIITFG